MSNVLGRHRPVDLRAPDAFHQMIDALRTHGVVTFAGVHDRMEALHLARSLIVTAGHRDSDADGVTMITRRAAVASRPGFAGFNESELFPHTEGSALPRPPRMLMLACTRPAQAGGHTVLVDGRAVHADIAGDDREMLAALAMPRSAYFGDGPGHPAAVFEAAPDGRITIRLRLDNLVRFSATVAPYISRLRRIIDRHRRAIALGPGEGIVLLNDRCLHGRTQFTGERVMLRILGTPLPTVPMPAGFISTMPG